MYGVAAALAALAGFAAVYVSLQAGGNDRAPSVSALPQAIEPKPADTAGAIATAPGVDTNPSATNAANSLKAYARGAMVTFVAKKEPTVVNKVTFKKFSTGDEGAVMTLADWKGRVVLLNLWATWCAPCRKEMPDLVKLKDELAGENFDLVAVSIDRGGPEKPRKFLNQIGAQSLGLYQAASTEIAGPLKAFGMPTTILFDRQGRELGRLVGPADWASDEAKALIKAAIAGAG